MAGRIHLTADDLARTRIAPTYGPLSETLFAAAWQVRRRGHPVLDRWRSRLRVRPHEWGATVRALTQGSPLGRQEDRQTPVDVFTIMGATRDADEGRQRLFDADRSQVLGELELPAEHFVYDQLPVPPDLAALINRARSCENPGQLVGDALHAAFDYLLQPHWPRITAYLDVQHRRRAKVMAEHGIEGLLDTLHVNMRWRCPVLEVYGGTHDRDYYPAGRGLLLVPSMFLTDRPLLYHPDFWDAAQPFVVFFPAVPDVLESVRLFGADESTSAGRGLGALLGHTRAAALEALEDECTTSELAARISTSLATASEHASVLRAAGLINSQRRGKTMRHWLTSLGESLLNGDVDTFPSNASPLPLLDPRIRSA
jgi:DNA-binding transcriptional ArsR family regulator